MNTDNHFTDDVEFKEVRAKVVESVGHVLVLADGAARFFRTTIISGQRSGLTIYSDDFFSRESLFWVYGKELEAGSYHFDVKSLFRNGYRDPYGQEVYYAKSGDVYVDVTDNQNGTFTHDGWFLNISYEDEKLKVSLSGSFTVTFYSSRR